MTNAWDLLDLELDRYYARQQVLEVLLLDSSETYLSPPSIPAYISNSTKLTDLPQITLLTKS